MRAAFARLCAIVQASANGGGGAVSAAAASAVAATRRQLLGLAVLLSEWRRVLEPDSVSPSQPDARRLHAPRLHAQCFDLVQLSLQIFGASVLVDLRRAAPAAPMLTLDEERQLATSLHLHASNSANAAAGGAEGGGAAAARACTTSAVLSGWPSLEEEALRALAAPTAPPPDAALLELLVQRGHLPRLARTGYWQRVLELLSGVADEALPLHAVCALGAARLHGHAGSIVLHRSRCHIAMHSPAAQLAVLRAYVQQQSDADTAGCNHALRALQTELTSLATRTSGRF